jgi:hypothetical protein
MNNEGFCVSAVEERLNKRNVHKGERKNERKERKGATTVITDTHTKHGTHPSKHNII